jgi:hypothetical protein
VYRSKVFHRLKFNHDLAFHQQNSTLPHVAESSRNPNTG